MRKIIILIFLLIAVAIPVQALDIQAPEAPRSAEQYMPEESESFAEGLWHIIKLTINELQPNVAQAAKLCLSLIAVMLFISVLKYISETSNRTTELAGVAAVSMILLQSTNTMITLGIQTVQSISEYSKLLLPVMTAAMSAQGYMSTSAALYTGTAVFNTFLSSIIAKLLVPMIYVFICLAVANSAIRENALDSLKNLVKWLMTWGLKIILYIFTGYISITGVVSGSADASAVKAAKLAINGVVPVVGSILSDASEAVLVGAGVVKNAAGVYGLFAILSICISPFVQIGIHYLLLKITVGICSVMEKNTCIVLLKDFASVMGIVLAMTGTMCLLVLISTVCFMKGTI